MSPQRSPVGTVEASTWPGSPTPAGPDAPHRSAVCAETWKWGHTGRYRGGCDQGATCPGQRRRRLAAPAPARSPALARQRRSAGAARRRAWFAAQAFAAGGGSSRVCSSMCAASCFRSPMHPQRCVPTHRNCRGIDLAGLAQAHLGRADSGPEVALELREAMHRRKHGLARGVRARSVHSTQGQWHALSKRRRVVHTEILRHEPSFLFF